MADWGKLKGKKKAEAPPEEESEPEPEVQEAQFTENPEEPEAEGVTGPKLPPNLNEEQQKAIQIYYLWREALSNYEKPDLYRMLMDVLSELIALETYDLDDRIDFILDAINETREKVGLEPVEEPDYDDEDDDEEYGDEEYEDEEDEADEK